MTITHYITELNPTRKANLLKLTSTICNNKPSERMTCAVDLMVLMNKIWLVVYSTIILLKVMTCPWKRSKNVWN